jgi:CheY-like chemotaxis protein
VCKLGLRLLALANALAREHSVWVLLKPEDRREHRKLMEERQDRLSGKARSLRHTETAAWSCRKRQVRPCRRLRQAATRLRGDKVLKVMLVEDNQINRMLAEKILQSAGHQVRHFPTVGRGCRCHCRQPRPSGQAGFDVILMDILMPGMDGLEATRRIRALEARLAVAQPVPVLALSANARRDDQKASLAAGMDGYLAKPFDRADLEQAIHRLALARAA